MTIFLRWPWGVCWYGAGVGCGVARVRLLVCDSADRDCRRQVNLIGIFFFAEAHGGHGHSHGGHGHSHGNDNMEGVSLVLRSSPGSAALFTNC